MKNFKLLIALVAVVFSVACAEKDKKSAPAPKQEEQKPTPPLGSAGGGGGSTSNGQTPTVVNAPITSYPKEFIAELVERSSRAFNEQITMQFSQYGSFFSTHLYVFQKSFLGKTDETVWWGKGDDVTIVKPWEMISVDLKAMKVYGGTKAGSGAIIGNVRYDGHDFKIEMLSDFTVDAKTQQVSLTESPHAVKETECPVLAKTAGVCDLYKSIYSVLSSIDYSAMGDVGGGVAADVMNANTVIDLAKSVFMFKPDVDQIRSKYLVPLIKSITQLKKLKTADQSDRAAYMMQTRAAYSNLVITTLDTLLKTQKMMPEALLNGSTTILGSALAYVGLEKAGDKVIAYNQPAWFKQIVAPIIREFGVLGIDLLFNGSKTSFQSRLDRFIAMEAQVRNAIERLCKQSPKSDVNECKNAAL